MDKKIENINIEKNKELFEYEMTEVILKLKGEFASFSGEGTVFEDSKVSDEDLRLELHSLKEVEVDKYEGEVPTIKKFPVITLREVAIDSNRKSKSAIQIDAVKKVQIKDIKKEEIHISIPNTNYQFSELDLDNAEVGVADESVKQVVTVPKVSINCSSIDKIEIVKREVAVPETKYNFKEMQLKSVKCPDLRQIEFKMIPRISFSWEGSFEETKRLVMFDHNVPKFVIRLKKDDLTVEIRRPMITADVPSVANLALSVDSVKIDKIRINIPKTNIVCKYEITEHKTEFYHLEPNVHKINIGSLKEVVIHKPDLDVTDTVRPKPICIKPVNNRHIIVDVPSTDTISLVSDYTKIRKKNVIFKMPQVPQIKRCFITQYKPFQRKVIEVAVPNFKNEQLTINTVEVKPMHKVELPSKPNVDEDISRIILLATNKQ